MKKFKLVLVWTLAILMLVGVMAGCNKKKDGKYVYDAADLKYADKKNQVITWLPIIGDFKKTNDGAAVGAFKVSNDETWVGLVVVGKTEASVAFYYDMNGNVYAECKGSFEHNGETYYYSESPSWHINDVGNPYTSKKNTYCATYGSSLEMAKHMVEMCDTSKLAVPTISTVEDLKKLESSSGTFMLANDIDLAGMSWTPIKGFSGSIDGAGHTIKNFKISGTNGNFGFFDEIKGATISNITFEGIDLSVIGTTGDVGGIAGISRDSRFSNVKVYGKVSAILTDNVGGLVGYAENTTITNCVNYAEVTGLIQVGGIAGQYAKKVGTDDGVTENLENYGSINGLATGKDEGYTGGVFGRTNFWPGSYKKNSGNWLHTLINCNNYGIINNAGTRTGGVVGAHSTSRWSGGDTYVDIAYANCKNAGFVSGEGDYVGGIAGSTSPCRSIISCENTGNINGSSTCVGGIIGTGTVKEGFQMSKNSGNITGQAFVGGIIGHSGGVVSNCENNGIVKATGITKCDTSSEETAACVGGIAGVSSTYVEKCVNNGTIISVAGGSCVGGIAGYMRASNGTVIEGNENHGNIEATGGSKIGGIVGKIFATRPGKGTGEYTFSGNNTGNITTTDASCVGGIIGYVTAQSDWSYGDRTYIIVINSQNSGIIIGNDKVAGIIGLVNKYAKRDDIYWSTNNNIGELQCRTEACSDFYNYQD